MKKIMIVLMLTLGVNVSAQMSGFEGLWKSESSSYYAVITHNEIEDSLIIHRFSFNDNTVVSEHIINAENDTLKTNLWATKNKWEVNVDYVVINDTTIHAHITGSANETLIYKKIID